jgi:hypothetical protein
MKELVFLLEEPSIREVLLVLVPPLVPSDVVCRFIPHQGIKDLEKSIPRKLRAWTNADARFVVVRDKHFADCRKVKQHLLNLCNQGHRQNTLVRIVCHELESWFLGDLAAVEDAYCLRGIGKRQAESKFRTPDKLPNAEQELRRLVPQYQKIGGSRRIAPHLNVSRNKSHSFSVFISGIRRLAEDNPRKL